MITTRQTKRSKSIRRSDTKVVITSDKISRPSETILQSIIIVIRCHCETQMSHLTIEYALLRASRTFNNKKGIVNT